LPASNVGLPGLIAGHHATGKTDRMIRGRRRWRRCPDSLASNRPIHRRTGRL